MGVILPKVLRPTLPDGWSAGRPGEDVAQGSRQAQRVVPGAAGSGTHLAQHEPRAEGGGGVGRGVDVLDRPRVGDDGVDRSPGTWSDSTARWSGALIPAVSPPEATRL